MADDERFWYNPNSPQAPPRQPTPGELLFAFVRDHDHKHFRCELRDNGAYGFEAQYLEGGELLFSHGLFSTRAAAVQWVEQMRPTVEKGGDD